ncbi:8953_t:CDS:2 [Funneliformis geosporum]|uniref:4207_t:CDS:1 n=1 Tax=Funneliformis geosporum TaxID=1117311 RepID=A0A9W4T764_9GLOM|nr:4207_t:CDS:2 [Funneliformis geosporum]CAI2195145.1 8953_t:CDS:2 [Funneliformis geosporum]
MTSLPPLEPTISQLHTLSVESLIYEKQRLDNSLFHLNRSNEDMKKFDENDKDFQLAIKENEELITRHREKIKMIQDLLKERQQNGNICITTERPVQIMTDSNSIQQAVDTQQETLSTTTDIQIDHNVNIFNNTQDESEDGIYL